MTGSVEKGSSERRRVSDAVLAEVKAGLERNATSISRIEKRMEEIEADGQVAYGEIKTDVKGLSGRVLALEGTSLEVLGTAKGIAKATSFWIPLVGGLLSLIIMTGMGLAVWSFNKHEDGLSHLGGKFEQHDVEHDQQQRALAEQINRNQNGVAVNKADVGHLKDDVNDLKGRVRVIEHEHRDRIGKRNQQ